MRLTNTQLERLNLTAYRVRARVKSPPRLVSTLIGAFAFLGVLFVLLAIKGA